MQRSLAKNSSEQVWPSRSPGAATSEAIVVVSDVSIGYGTPQVLALARSLARHYGQQVLILEPDQLERPQVLKDDAEAKFERVVTAAHPYSWPGRSEFCRRVRDRIEKLKPRLVVVASYYPLPALLTMKHRPEMTILYQLEHMGTQAFELELGRATLDRIDLIIFPESNRARLDIERLRPPENVKVVMLYNCASILPPILPGVQRNGRIFYGGTFDKNRTNARYFLNNRVQKLPIDIYGQISGFPDAAEVAKQLVGIGGGSCYRGYVPSGQPYFDTLSQYCYSIVMWNPQDEATEFAAPNKFFDSIAAGVPPIAAPHPMCVEIINRFRCGILIDDWTLDGFIDRLNEAMATIGSEEYEAMVRNCAAARDSELNWPYQMRKLVRHLPPR